jgi:hypothetical protein
MEDLQARKINIINSLLLIENDNTMTAVEEFFRSHNLESKQFSTVEEE